MSRRGGRKADTEPLAIDTNVRDRDFERLASQFFRQLPHKLRGLARCIPILRHCRKFDGSGVGLADDFDISFNRLGIDLLNSRLILR